MSAPAATTTTATNAVRTARRAVLLAVVVGVAASALWVAGRAAVSDVQLMQVRWQIGQWRSGSAPLPHIVDWGAARNTLSGALATAPDDPQIHESLGYLYAIRAQSAAKLPALFQPLMRQAQDSYRNAARLRPMSGATWANVALASHLLAPVSSAPAQPSQPNQQNQPNQPNQQTLLWDAFDRALLYGQREPSVQRTTAEIGFARWAQLSPVRRSQLLAMVAGAWPPDRPVLLTIAHAHGRAEADGTP